MARCKGCGAEIIFIKTSSRKSMPCNARPVIYWENRRGKGKIVTPNGEVLFCDFTGEADKATGLGYIPHWATCPKAENFKQTGSKGENLC